MGREMVRDEFEWCRENLSFTHVSLMQDHRNLRVWRRAHALALLAISSSTKFSRDVLWLRGQIHRAAASISSNIAEGAGQETSAQFGRFLVIALASSNELSNHATLARDLGHWPDHVFVHVEDEIEAIRAMLIVLLRRIREREGRMVNEPERGQSEVNASVDPEDMTAH